MIDDRTFDLIEKIAREHSHKPFGFLTQEDLKGEIWVICLSKLDEYDPAKGTNLEHYLRVLVKNRLVNKFKEITKSVRSPCPKCVFYDQKGTPDCKKFGDNKYDCDKWKNYHLSVESRNSLLNASEQKIERENDSNSLKAAITKETREFLESKIDSKFTRDLEQLMSSGKLTKQKLKKLKREINRVLLEREGVFQLNIKGKSRE